MKPHFNFPSKLDIKIYSIFLGQSQAKTYRENRGEKYITVDVPIIDDIQFMLGLCHSRDDFHPARDATCQENKRGMYIGIFRMYVMAAGQHCNLWRMGNTHLMYLIAYKHIGG